MRQIAKFFRVLNLQSRRISTKSWKMSAKAWKALLSMLLSTYSEAKIALVISVITALATVWAVPYTRDSSKAAVETLKRSDEDLCILVDVDRAAPVSVSFNVLNDYSELSIVFSAHADVINTGGSSAVVTDRTVGTYTNAQKFESRADIFDPSTGHLWSKFAVIHPNKPVQLNLVGKLSSNNLQLPTVTKALAMLFVQHEHQNGDLQRQFESIAALSQEVHSHAGEDTASEFDNFLYGPAAKPGPLSSNPWSEKGEIGYSRIILKISTAAHRIYRSSPGLLIVGPDPTYSIQ